jgi:hypothetical protein
LHQLDRNYANLRIHRQAAKNLVDAPHQSGSWASVCEVEMIPLAPIHSHEYEQETTGKADLAKPADLVNTLSQASELGDL